MRSESRFVLPSLPLRWLLPLLLLSLPLPLSLGFFRRRRCLCWLLLLPLLLWVPGQRLQFFSTPTKRERCDQVACAKVTAVPGLPIAFSECGSAHVDHSRGFLADLRLTAQDDLPGGLD